MTLDKLLIEFYKKNGIPENGGIYKDTFEIKVLGINLNLPNPKFRKDVIHIHDIQHLLNKCDTSWKGEAFIAGWETSTGFWKYFPICIFSFWAMGYSFWLHPKAVFNGFKKGLNDIGIIDLKISKADFMKMEFEELQKITKKDKSTEMGIIQWSEFIFWLIISQVVLLIPLVVLIIGIIWMIIQKTLCTKMVKRNALPPRLARLLAHLKKFVYWLSKHLLMPQKTTPSFNTVYNKDGVHVTDAL